MSAVIHQTPGLIPIEAFTIAGLSAKPDSINPIGRFGTGLKYAIAVLMRLNIKVTLFIGREEYVFYTKAETFRGVEYSAIRMKKRKGPFARWTYHELPFTTQYGRDWQLWQVFRELHANTLDEGGTTYLYKPDASGCVGIDDTTRFVIEGKAYEDVYHERGTIFLEGAANERTSSEGIQVLDAPSKHIYFRGLRVMDLHHDAMFTYNFLQEIALTEDRTVKHPALVEALIVGYMQETADTSFVERAVGSPKKDSFEGRIGHSSGYVGSSYRYATPSAAYIESARESVNPTAREVWNQQQPTIPDSVRLTIKIPKPELSDAELGLLLTAVHQVHADGELYSATGVPVGAPSPDDVVF